MDQLDPRLFFAIVHALIRTNDSPEEIARTERIYEWFSNNFPLLAYASEQDQKRLLGVFWKYWTKHNAAPSIDVLDHAIRDENQPAAMLDQISQYQRHAPDLQVIDSIDADFYLNQRVEDWDRCLLSDNLFMARVICLGSISGAKATDPPLRGPDDAITYLMKGVQAGLAKGHKTHGFELAEHAESILHSYDEIARDAATGRNIIPSGLPSLDRITGGLRRKSFWGVLGYAGQRKSAICRTIAYNAAKAGFRVLHIVLESEAQEEMNIYGVMHSHCDRFMSYGDDWMRLDIRRFNEGELTDSERNFLAQVVIPDLEMNLSGAILIRQPSVRSWTAIQQLIQMEYRIAPIDLVIIDYLTLVDVPDAKDKVQAVNHVIAQLKQMALTHGDRGFAALTPVQGSRNGMEKAKKDGGVWDKEGIGQYNEFEKSLDVLVYAYQDGNLQSQDQINIGTCKSRRSADMPVETMMICPASGTVRPLFDFFTARQLVSRNAL